MSSPTTVAMPLSTLQHHALFVPEIITNVLSKLPGPQHYYEAFDNIPTALCLVCKTWLPEARRILYMHVTLHHAREILKLRATFWTRPELGRHVRVLKMNSVAYDLGNQKKLETAIPIIVGTCTHLKYLHLQGANGWQGSIAFPKHLDLVCFEPSKVVGYPSDPAAILRAFPNLRSLVLTTESAKFYESMRVAPPFTNVRTLSLQGSLVLDSSGKNIFQILSPSLPEVDTLILQECQFSMATRHDVLPHFPKLVNLALLGYRSKRAEGVDPSIIWAVGPNLGSKLRTLTICANSNLNISDQGWLRKLPPNLETLSITATRFYGHPMAPSFVLFVQTLCSDAFPCFRKLKLGCYLDKTGTVPGGDQWDSTSMTLVANGVELDISEVNMASRGNLSPSPWIKDGIQELAALDILLARR